MVAYQKRRPGADGSPQPFHIVLFLAATAFIFFVGFSFGGRQEKSKTDVTAKELHHQEEALEKQQVECNQHHEQVQQIIGRLGEEEASVQDTHTSLEQQNADLKADHNNQEAQIADCETQLDIAKTRWTDDDHETAEKIKRLAAEVETMEELLRDLTEGHGMRQVLLIQALIRQRKLNADLRGLLNLTDEAPTDSELVTKHQTALKEIDDGSKARLEQQFNVTVNTWDKFVYLPENHTLIFLETRDLFGNVVRPRYFGRLMQDVVPGLLVVEEPLPVTILSKAIISITSVALCAYRNDNPNFTYPNSFGWRHLEDVEQLNEIIDTPLVTFCSKCKNHQRTKAFIDACKNDRIINNYGSYDFWATRSMIRFATSVERHCEEFIADHQINPKTTLAVVFHASKEAAAMCETANRILPGPHYLHVRGGMSLDVAHGTEDAEMRCAPSITYLEQRIREVIAAELKKSEEGGLPITTIYLSNEPEALATLHKVDFGAGIEIISGEQHSGSDEAVDILIASRMKALLVSAYLPQSQVVTEQFLLNTQFEAEHLYFF